MVDTKALGFIAILGAGAGAIYLFNTKEDKEVESVVGGGSSFGGSSFGESPILDAVTPQNVYNINIESPTLDTTSPMISSSKKSSRVSSEPTFIESASRQSLVDRYSDPSVSTFEKLASGTKKEANMSLATGGTATAPRPTVKKKKEEKLMSSAIPNNPFA